MPSPVIPKKLEPGATIAFVSPSARLNDEMSAVMMRATAVLSGRGYRVRELFTPDTGIPKSSSGIPTSRACTGSYTRSRDSLSRRRRLAAGILHQAPFRAKGDPSWRDPASSMPPGLAPTTGWSWLRAGKGQGRLFGGCITVMARLGGVRAVVPDWRGRIVFMETPMGDDETSGIPLHRVRAGIADLIAQGVFDEAKGLVVGRPFGYDTEQLRKAYAGVIKGLLCEGRLAEKKFPILFNVDFGHTKPMVTLPYDVLAELDSDKDRFAILEPAVI